MHIDSQQGGVACGVSLRQQSQQDARQHIAAATCGHAGITRGVEAAFSIGRDDDGVSPFQYNVYFGLPGQFAGTLQTLVAVLAFAHQPLQFLGVRGQDASLRQAR